jgi:hypothetical protein
MGKMREQIVMPAVLVRDGRFAPEKTPGRCYFSLFMICISRLGRLF